MTSEPPAAAGLPMQLARHARLRGEHPAIVTAARSLSYSELHAQVEGLARGLIRQDIGAGAVVGVACCDELQHLLLALALMRVGAAQFTAIASGGADAAGAADRLGATAVLDDPAVQGMLENPPDQLLPAPEAVADSSIYLATSGTSGQAKLVCLLDSDLVAQAPRHIRDETERFACLAHIEHNFSKRHRLYCVAQGATNVFIDAPLASLSEQLSQLSVGTLHLSAYQARELLSAPGLARLSSLRLKIGGSHVPMALRQRLQAQISQDLHTGYGTTETGAIAFATGRDHDESESVGRPLPGIQLRILDPAGQPLAAGERGQIVIAGAGLFRNYHGQPELTAARMIDGWFHTGDIGSLDEGGRLVLAGRADDMFVFNSMNIYPEELETVIRQFPGIVDAAVVPRSSAVHGDIPVALLQQAAGADIDTAALRDYLRPRTGLRCPRQFVTVDRIPRNATGKIRRDAALALLEQG